MDEDEMAFKAKQRAGTPFCRRDCPTIPPSKEIHIIGRRMLLTTRVPHRRQGEQGDGREGQGEGAHECRPAGYQEIGQEVSGGSGCSTDCGAGAARTAGHIRRYGGHEEGHDSSGRTSNRSERLRTMIRLVMNPWVMTRPRGFVRDTGFL